MFSLVINQPIIFLDESIHLAVYIMSESNERDLPRFLTARGGASKCLVFAVARLDTHAVLHSREGKVVLLQLIKFASKEFSLIKLIVPTPDRRMINQWQVLHFDQ